MLLFSPQMLTVDPVSLLLSVPQFQKKVSLFFICPFIRFKPGSRPLICPWGPLGKKRRMGLFSNMTHFAKSSGEEREREEKREQGCNLSPRSLAMKWLLFDDGRISTGHKKGTGLEATRDNISFQALLHFAVCFFTSSGQKRFGLESGCNFV